jgi:hypothetical protein
VNFLEEAAQPLSVQKVAAEVVEFVRQVLTDMPTAHLDDIVEFSYDRAKKIYWLHTATDDDLEWLAAMASGAATASYLILKDPK